MQSPDQSAQRTPAAAGRGRRAGEATEIVAIITDGNGRWAQAAAWR